MRAALFWLALLLGSLPISAADPVVSKLTVHLDGLRVLVDLEATGIFDRTFRERIESGLATTLSYEFELLRDRKRWLDAPLREGELQVIARYDAMNREYLVHFKLDGQLVDSKMVREMTEVERLMTRFEGLPVFTLEGVRDDVSARSRLLVKARAVLGTRTVFLFIPSQITTDWRDSKKFHLPPTPPAG